MSSDVLPRSTKPPPDYAGNGVWVGRGCGGKRRTRVGQSSLAHDATYRQAAQAEGFRMGMGKGRDRPIGTPGPFLMDDDRLVI
jgi:hypothetical protein